MLTRRRFVLTAMSAAALAAPARAQVLEWRGAALGGEATLRVHGARDAGAAALAEAVAEIVRLERLFSLSDRRSQLSRLNAAGIARLERLFSLYDATSQLSRLNAAGRLAAPALDLVAALRAAERWRAATAGAFDMRVQPLWRARAEGRDPEAAREAAQAPVAIASAAVTLAPGAGLTLNGLAQGTIADRVSAALARRGFTRMMVDAGEMRLSGPARRVAVPQVGVTLRLADAALAVSAPGALRFADGAGHILDPRGAGAERWRAVAVVARAGPDAAETADALSTAFAVSAPDLIDAVARAAGAAALARATDGALRRLGDPALLGEVMA